MTEFEYQLLITLQNIEKSLNIIAEDVKTSKKSKERISKIFNETNIQNYLNEKWESFDK